ncbi:hypothetical protein [Sinorhizobium meliloti]|uniref:hypothetical protein n=1 Tax=Rhizobium meliloti TaxID=382 RepID=UPI001F20B487|nr:hypothetical protein [Sinorhizobium meliloti]
MIFVQSGMARQCGRAEEVWGSREAMAASVLAASVVNAARLQLGRRARQFGDILEALVNKPDLEATSGQTVESVVSGSWDDAGAAVDAAFRRALGA